MKKLKIEVRKELLTLAETSEFLNVSKSYLYKLTSSKKIPFYKPAGKLIYFLKSEVERWVLDGKIISTSEANKIFLNNFKTRHDGKQ